MIAEVILDQVAACVVEVSKRDKPTRRRPQRMTRSASSKILRLASQLNQNNFATARRSAGDQAPAGCVRIASLHVVDLT